MDMDTDYPLNLVEIKQLIDTAEVLIIGFTIFAERLLVDNRYNAQEGPLITVIPPVSSMEERRRYLRELRPRFALPERLMFFVWPKPIASLERLGVWGSIVERALNSGHRGILGGCHQTWQDLRRLEREGIIAAVKGEGYHDLWRSRRGR